jgi:DUF4097 and DUF4098 domain-containing protein YvlB
MKTITCFLTLGLFAITPVALHAKIVRTVEKTFTVQPGGTFRGSTQGGNFTIRSGDVGTVEVTARQTIRAGSDKEADELLADLTLRLEQEGNDVVAEAKYDRKASWGRKSWPPVSVDFTVTVPHTYNLRLATSGGNIKVGDLKGSIVARTSGGNLSFERIDGDIEGRTSGGDIYLREGTAEAKLHTSGGNIRVERAGGRTQVSTSGGDIRLDEVKELVSARTSGGNVHATITGPLTADTELGTSGGDVVVKLRRDIGFHLDASTSGGDVSAEGLTLTIDRGGIGKRRLSGTVNGGGPLLRLRTSGGNIKIRTAN